VLLFFILIDGEKLACCSRVHEIWAFSAMEGLVLRTL
jgi:hypothetical protein